MCFTNQNILTMYFSYANIKLNCQKKTSDPESGFMTFFMDPDPENHPDQTGMAISWFCLKRFLQCQIV